MLDPLCVIYIDVGNVVSAGVSPPLKRELQVPIPVEGFETFRDLIARHRIVQSRRNGMKKRRVFNLLDKSRCNLNEHSILLHPHDGPIVVRTYRTVAQRSRTRLGRNVQQTSFQPWEIVESKVKVLSLKEGASRRNEPGYLGLMQETLQLGVQRIERGSHQI